ncbi:MAG: tyrosine-protein phosphatase [Clostridia bacterium]
MTPHYITGYYENSGRDICLLKGSLQKIVEEKQISVNLHQGMEVYITEEIEELIKKGEIITLANSNYILMEFPMNSVPRYIDNVLFLMKNMGYQVIIAHPERYKFVQEDIEYAKQWVEKGCLLQANFGSIVDIYGKEAKKTVKKLFKLNLISFLGTDTHKQGTIYTIIPQIIKKLKKVISEEKLYEITEKNPRKILCNEILDFRR